MGEEEKTPAPENEESGAEKDAFKDELKEFAEMDEINDDDLKELEDAFLDDQAAPESTEAVSQEGIATPAEGLPTEEIPAEQPEFKPEIGEDLEAKIQEELERKKKIQGVKTVTREEFIEYCKTRRNKIVYHALWHLIFNIEDHEVTKKGLYDALKEVTSKSAIEPIEEHKFYFGLGFILRLKLFDQNVVQFVKGKLKVMVNVENMKEILQLVGDPISDRPVISKTQKDKMFSEFLNDNFLDI
jgi:hypothetical protein